MEYITSAGRWILLIHRSSGHTRHIANHLWMASSFKSSCPISVIFGCTSQENF